MSKPDTEYEKPVLGCLIVALILSAFLVGMGYSLYRLLL